MPLPDTFFGTTAAALAVCLCLPWSPALRAESAVVAAGQGLPATAANFSCPDLTLGPVMPPTPDRSGAPVIIFARELDAGKTSVGEARGSVELFRADQHITTERILYDPVHEVVTVPGDLGYADQQVWFRGREAHYSFAEESGRFSWIDYGLTGSSANGSAELAELIGGHTSILHRVDYTSCPGEQPDWQLQARELELRHDEGMGIARGARLTFKDVPILYAPYFTFPLDDRRKSGFLYPNLGHNSDSGLEVGAPWYWNIAPNQDAVIEPRYYTNRGFMLSGDYRFLTRRTSGAFEGDYLPNDKKTREERYRYLFQHFAVPAERWDTALIVDRVSDDNYYQDFGTSLGQTSRQYLRSSAELRGVGRYWNLQLMADDFQVIDEAVPASNEPYRRLPRLAYWSDRPLTDSGLSLALDSELVYFDRDVGTTGARVDLLPRVYWDLQNHWGFLKPSAGYRYTAYDLDPESPDGDDSPATGTAIASFDAGLVFDRHAASGALQTLEPRLFYLYVPHEQQDDQPLFDTGEFTFGFSQLFNTNRFAGGDRQGDANQLSLAVSTRRFDGATGQALWSLGLGQIFYFDQQRVQLEEAPVMDEDLSPFLAEFLWRPFSRFSGAAGLQWDWEESQLDLGMVGLQYRGSQEQRAAFEYRFRRDRVDQFDFRFDWPVGERWRILSRVNYSFDDDDLLEFQGGVEYESCCWAI
ncbi:MAG: LPS-assembly protein LptD [Lysobacterales bacterium]|nr:MAG: LPS-assembly protein LptD [Xanthomonadales bacterium]